MYSLVPSICPHEIIVSISITKYLVFNIESFTKCFITTCIMIWQDIVLVIKNMDLLKIIIVFPTPE